MRKTFYDARDIDLLQATTEPMIETVYEAQNLDPISTVVEIGSDEDDLPAIKKSTPFGTVIESIEQPEKFSDPPFSKDSIYLPTPPSSQATPAPADPQPDQSETSPADDSIVSLNKGKKHNVGADLDESNILPEGVVRSRKPRKQVYLTYLNKAHDNDHAGYHNSFFAFSAARSYYQSEFASISSIVASAALHASVPPTIPSSISVPFRLHRDSLPSEPKTFKQLANHPHQAGFLLAMKTELKALRGKITWKEVPVPSHKVDTIPTMWVYTYKFDKNGYLVKYKSRLVARGDMQRRMQDTYAATFAAKIFRSLIALIAAYDLETRQFDAVNAFANSPIDEITYCKPPEGWKVASGDEPNVLLLLLRALYGLKQAPVL